MMALGFGNYAETKLTAEDKEFLEELLLREFDEEFDYQIGHEERDFFILESCVKALKGIGSTYPAMNCACNIVELRRITKK